MKRKKSNYPEILAEFSNFIRNVGEVQKWRNKIAHAYSRGIIRNRTTTTSKLILNSKNKEQIEISNEDFDKIEKLVNVCAIESIII